VLAQRRDVGEQWHKELGAGSVGHGERRGGLRAAADGGAQATNGGQGHGDELQRQTEHGADREREESVRKSKLAEGEREGGSTGFIEGREEMRGRAGGKKRRLVFMAAINGERE
jgi:hypothetical protein